MARTFTTAADARIEAVGAVSGSNNYTFGIWARPIVVGNSSPRALAGLDGSNVQHGIVINQVGPKWVYTWGGVGFSDATGLTPIFGVWQYVAIVVSGSGITIYRSNADRSLSSYTGSFSPATPAFTAFNIGAHPTIAARGFDGRLAQASIWTTQLTVNEIQALALGVQPKRIRPSAQLHQWPIWGIQSPEPDMVAGGISGTIVGSAPRGDHAPTTFSEQQPVAPPASAGASWYYRNIVLDRKRFA